MIGTIEKHAPARRAFLALGLLAGGLLAGSVALAGVQPLRAAEAPAERVSSFAEQGFALLADESRTEQDRRQVFRGMLDEFFDLKTTGRVALGRHWKQASDQQREEYSELFQKYVVVAVASRMKGYAGETLQIDQTREVGDGEVLVSSTMNRPNQEAVRLEWRLLDKNGQWRIVDLVVEGVSMTITQRQEFDSVIKTGGDLNALIEKLRQQTASL